MTTAHLIIKIGWYLLFVLILGLASFDLISKDLALQSIGILSLLYEGATWRERKKEGTDGGE